MTSSSNEPTKMDGQYKSLKGTAVEAVRTVTLPLCLHPHSGTDWKPDGGTVMDREREKGARRG